MLFTTFSITIKTISVEETDETLIARGLLEFHYCGKDGVVSDEIPYRSKGNPAVIINSVGIGTTGTAEGYIDLQVQDRGSFKEKIATLVIRNFVAAAPLENVVQTPAKETPDFAKKLLDETPPKKTAKKRKTNKELAAIA